MKVKSNPKWLDEKLKEYLVAISKRRKNATVIFYASAFLQKPDGNVSITREDINGFMNVLFSRINLKITSPLTGFSTLRSINLFMLISHSKTK